MNGKKAKQIRRIARDEMNTLKPATARDLVPTTMYSKDGVRTGYKLINDPSSERAMAKAMNKAYVRHKKSA